MAEAIYGRPELHKDMGSRRFLEFYYLETELIEFCKKNGLNTEGDKKELTERIADYMRGKKSSEPKFIPKHTASDGVIDDATQIEPNFSYGDKHMEYFEAAIGAEFVMFDDFLIWLESNAGKTYGESVNIWFLIRDDLGAY